MAEAVSDRGGSPPLVLIIDDAEDFRVFLAEFLQSNGFRAVTAKNGFEGVSLAASSAPDVILMDFSMPGMDGLDDTAPEEAGLLGENPIVALTGQTLLPDMSRMAAIGFAASR